MSRLCSGLSVKSSWAAADGEPTVSCTVTWSCHEMKCYYRQQDVNKFDMVPQSEMIMWAVKKNFILTLCTHKGKGISRILSRLFTPTLRTNMSENSWLRVQRLRYCASAQAATQRWDPQLTPAAATGIAPHGACETSLYFVQMQSYDVHYTYISQTKNESSAFSVNVVGYIYIHIYVYLHAIENINAPAHTFINLDVS